MLQGLDDYLEKTKHIPFYENPHYLNTLSNLDRLVDQSLSPLEKRKKWILKKHEEWETKIWFEGDKSARDI